MERQLKEALEKWAQDPVREMGNHTPKYEPDGKFLEKPPTAFARQDVEERLFVEQRDTVRCKMKTVVDGVLISLEDIIPGRAPIELQDRPDRLVDVMEHSTLPSMEAAGLTSAKLDVSPWSDDYWALYSGVLGKRYADEDFPGSEIWEENYEYVLDRPIAEIVARAGSDPVDMLSPSEKYDLLIGDPSGALTRAMWAEGQGYFDRYGKVETWMGICHGWAPAAYMLDRPARAITLLAADGRTRLRFFPSDIKALASLLWAKVPTVTRFIGSRCNEKDPEVDPRTGRSLSSQAFDTNPGSWHQSVVNQVGVAGRSLVIDATYDYEVWNQPVISYEYWYFNPQQRRFSRTLEGATVAAADFRDDYFREYRSDRAESMVGIAMQLDYVVETKPTPAMDDGPQNDKIVTVGYIYDLEIDAAGEIIGGEWYRNEHPDFLWTPSREARALTPADRVISGGWRRDEVMPAPWRNVARRVSPYGLPLGKVVERLIDFTNE